MILWVFYFGDLNWKYDLRREKSVGNISISQEKNSDLISKSSLVYEKKTSQPEINNKLN